MAQFQAPPRKKNYLDYSGLRLTAEKQQGAEKRPSWALTVVKNKARIDVYTNVPNDKKNGNIRMEMEANTFFLFVNAIFEAIDAPPGTKTLGLKYNDYTWNQGQRSQEPMPQATLHVGKDKSGRVFVSLTSYDDTRPKIPFIFDVPFKHDLVKNGQPVPDDEVSRMVARAYAEALKHVAPLVLTTEFVEPEKKDKGGNGGGQQNRGGGNRGGNAGGQKHATHDDDFAADGGDAAGSDFDDDFPM